MQKRIALFTLSLLALVAGHSANAASAVGTAKLKVIAALAISSVSDLDFGTAAQGDAAKTVAAGTSDTAENGSFKVSGEPNTAYTISLPSSVSLSASGSSSTVSVNAFTSYPNGSGTLSSSGSQSLFVGATRAAIPANLKAGSYSGTYTVTVVY